MSKYTLHYENAVTVIDLPSLFATLEEYGVSYELTKNNIIDGWDITFLNDSSILSIKVLTDESSN